MDVELLAEALEQCRQAFHFTREYVGEELLPAIPGWSWYDADIKAEAALAIYEEQRNAVRT